MKLDVDDTIVKVYMCDIFNVGDVGCRIYKGEEVEELSMVMWISSGEERLGSIG